MTTHKRVTPAHVRVARTSIHPWILALAMLGFALLAAVASARADAALELEVDDAQEVTLAGKSPSLRAVVEMLCNRAGIELQGYEAPDRAFKGSYRDVGANALLARLLREESHVMGLRTNGGGQGTRVAWLRVLGDQGSTGARLVPSAPAPAPMTPAQTFEADKERVLDLLQPAFEADEPQRETVIREIVKRLTNESEAREPLLGATRTDIAEEIAGYPDAYAVITRIGGALLDEETRSNFATISQQVRIALQKSSSQ
jgi:hypothetical protein